MAGLLGGLVGAGAMSLGHAVSSAMLPRPDAPPAAPPEDATLKVASAIVGVAGLRLRDDQKPVASQVVHYPFVGLVGAGYGAVATVVPGVAAAVGLPFGAVVWLGAHVFTVPALGLAEPPTRRPLRDESQEFGLHLLYGVATELVRRLL